MPDHPGLRAGIAMRTVRYGPMLARFQALPPVAQGMLLMIVTTLCFTTMQTMVRLMGEALPPFEVAFFRNLFGLLALAPIFLRHGIAPLRTKMLHLHALRGAVQAGGMLAFFTGVTMIPLAEVTALSFSAPLFGSLLAVVLLGEIIRMRRITALVAGFAGVLLVLRPGFAEVSTGALLIVASSLTWGLAITLIKVLARTESSVTQTVYMGLFMTPITFLPALLVWEWPAPEHYLWFAAIGAVGTVGHLAFAQAVKTADSTAVLPLDFLRLIWASLVGYFLFAETPDAWSWLGGAVIFASATYIAYRESRLARSRKGHDASTDT